MPDNLSIQEKLRLSKETGFDYLEISIDETDEKLARLDYTKQELLKIKHAMEAESFHIKTMCLSAHRRYPLGSHEKSKRDKSIEIMGKALEFSGELGIRIIQLAGYDVYYEKSDEKSKEFFLENLRKVTDMAASYGIVLGFETMETEFMNTISKSMFYVKYINSPYLGIYPDIGNLKNACVLYNIDITKDINAGRGHIFAAHLKETAPGIFRNMDFGTGHTEYTTCIEKLLEQGVRMFTGEFWHQGEKNYREIIKNANEFLWNKVNEAMQRAKLTIHN